MHFSRLFLGIASPLACAWLVIFGAVGDPAVAQVQDRQYGTAEIQAGYRTYASQCALCHGGNGDGINGVNLARQQFRRASTDDDIRRTITNGVAAAGMPSFNFSPAELNGVVAYIRSGFDLTGTSFKVGDVMRGKAIYDGKGACATCHRVNGIGPRTAPDLSDIGVTRKPSGIQNSLLDPAGAVLAINRPVRIVMNDGRVVRGRRLNEDTATVQLIDDQERLVSLEKPDIRQFEIGTGSNMPSSRSTLSDNEIADLLAYLLSLKG